MNQRGLTTGAGNSRENKVNREKRVSADILEGNFPCWKGFNGFTKKWAKNF
ncbi:MAG: hypothetical protein IK044_08130 [Methanobrevibacter sp.]|nr:hypothetical protein [Methanobrevibacter sp.]